MLLTLGLARVGWAGDVPVKPTDRATWTPNSNGSGVEVASVNGGGSFQVTFTPEARPAASPPSFYATQISGGYASACAPHGDWTRSPT